MSSPIDRHRRLRAVFDEALPLEPSARLAYLDHACDGDSDLRAQVLRLLAFHAEADSFLDQPLDPQSVAIDHAPFLGTDRFEVLGTLGAGGMGVVYEVHDRLRHEVVALKTLRRSGAADLYRLKREFRTLADVTHPNLVCLYELFVDAQQSFFTMERVTGDRFVEYVRRPDRSQLSIDRLMPALRQLVDGVCELHRQGKLHRDIKPSNVLVTEDGRVVILDFGLIAESSPVRAGQDAYGGTPAYMSPEEVSGGASSEASDWYSVGVTLYEALTGSLPFDGALPDLLRRKTSSDPTAPADVAPAVPADLSDVCMGLLHRSPDRRLAGPAALRALMRDAASPASLQRPSETLFIGRDRELQALDDAGQAVVNGGPRAVMVSGPSGIGKSALVQTFLNRLTARGDAVVLAGRCYENESVPYKALDGVVDDLSRYLDSIPAAQVEALLPPDVSALSRVFPVLLQVNAVARAASTPVDLVDPLRVRRRAFESLAALLAGLADTRPLIVWIDDLQWADADSIVLFDELLDAARPPNMLTLLSFRSEEVAAKPFLRTLLDREGRRGWSALAMVPMPEAEAAALIEGLLPREAGPSDHEKRRMIGEALGSPFVLEQLALSKGLSFHARLEALSPPARLFLETLAICGRPMAPEIVCDACDIASDRQALVVRLRTSRFIRSSGSSDRVETYHDRIREVLADQIVPDARRHVHRRMVSTLVARQSDDCEALFEHHRGAGDDEQASVQAGLAAEKASAALAFDRAASFFAHALDLAPSASAAQAWREGLASALANAERPAEAAAAYLRVAEDAGRTRRVELQRRAAEQFLIGGHIDRGLDLIRHVLESVGLRLATTPRRAAARLVWRRLRLGWRGLAFTPRRADEIDAETTLRLDTCWATATGLALVDLLSASDFIAQHLRLALDAGEPARIARGMAIESAARSANWQFRASAARLAAQAHTVAAQVGTPPVRATEFLADSISACATGHWRRARSSSEQALTILRDQCVGVTWEITIAQNTLIWALMYLGEMHEVGRRVPALLADARRRGNLYMATELCTRSNLVWLMADTPDEGEREATEAAARWSQKGFHRQHYSARLARVQTSLYRGDADTAWQRLVEQESSLRRSMLLHVQALRVEALYLRGRCAIAMAHEHPSDRRHFLSIARTCARRIARERMQWSDPIALLLHACIASVDDKRDDAAAYLEDAAMKFERADMNMYLAFTRRRLGALRGDDRGRALQREAESWMAAQPIRNPVCFTRMLAPGFDDDPVLSPV